MYHFHAAVETLAVENKTFQPGILSLGSFIAMVNLNFYGLNTWIHQEVLLKEFAVIGERSSSQCTNGSIQGLWLSCLILLSCISRVSQSTNSSIFISLNSKFTNKKKHKSTCLSPADNI